MKTLRTLVALVALLCTASASAIDWGVEAGADFNKISFSRKNMFGTNNRTGWFLGPKARINLPLGLAIDGAVLYDQRGMSYDYLDAAGVEQTKSKSLPYIITPVNLRYTFHITFIGLYLSTGPQWNWYVGKNGHVPGFYDRTQYDSQMRRSSFGWNVGAGLELMGHLQIGFTYNIGLNSMANVKDITGAIKDLDIDNNSCQLRVAYMF